MWTSACCPLNRNHTGRATAPVPQPGRAASSGQMNRWNLNQVGGGKWLIMKQTMVWSGAPLQPRLKGFWFSFCGWGCNCSQETKINRELILLDMKQPYWDHPNSQTGFMISLMGWLKMSGELRAVTGETWISSTIRGVTFRVITSGVFAGLLLHQQDVSVGVRDIQTAGKSSVRPIPIQSKTAQTKALI